jgi:phospholipase C
MAERKPTRRAVLSGGAAGLVSAGLPGCQPAPGGGEDTAAPAGPGQIDHVIVVMMENRSFDHYLGALKLVEGREIDGLTGAESNPDEDGDPVYVNHLEIHCQADPPHGWSASHSQFADGANSGFYLEHADGDPEQGAQALGYYTREELPIHYALADAYHVPERYFCSVMGPTWPNRLYGQAGTSEGQDNNEPPAGGGFAFKTVYKALDEVGEAWRYFYTDLPFIGLFQDQWDDERVSLLEEFFDACERGELPAFTWVDPGFLYNDDHPPHHPGLGQMFLALVHEALARSPLWERCLLVITYDEHGGFYDHVPPPKTGDDYAEEGFDQLGFRVPAVIAGPWVRPGTSHVVLDHTSTLKYVCERFGVEPWTARIAAATSLEVVLDKEAMARGEPLAPAVMPAFEVPESELIDDCFYGGGLSGGPRPGGQPELEDFVQRTRPGSIRTHELPALHRRLLALADRYHLLRRP